ncbi:MAG: 4-alpha-glucanotransferase, partial [Prevotella sp.]|nr:4-alpha-glucanotransferase [Prevotella sp.]
MKLQFNLEYQTTFGEELVLNMLSGEGKTSQTKVEQHKMTTLDGLHWFCEMSRSAKTSAYVDYYYSVYRGDQETRHEWLVEPHRLEFAAIRGVRYTIYDHWLDIPEDSYMYSSAFTDCVFARE